MKYKDNDMDDLFNKAGRHYPLKTEPKNWEAVEKALHGEQPAVPVKRNFFRRYFPLLLLLLLVPFAVIVYNSSEKTNTVVAGQKTADANKVQNKMDSELAGVNKEKVQSTIKPEKKLQQENELADAETINGNVTSEKKEVRSNVKQLNGSVGEATNTTINRTNNSDASKSSAASKNNDASENSDASKKNILKKQDLNAADRQKNEGNRDPIVYHDETINSPLNQIRKSKVELNELYMRRNVASLSDEVIQFNPPAVEIGNAATAKSIQGENDAQSVPLSKKLKNRDKPTFYYGISAGPNRTAIKSQEVKTMGFSTGLLVGYSFGRHWSVESGIQWTSKKYYTDGKYFDKAGAYIPSYLDVKTVDGGCNMFDIPVFVRYDFKVKKHPLFTSVGIISSSMHKETYTYVAGTGTNYYQMTKEYKNSGRYYLANLQLSAGYYFNFSSKLNLRVEPYINFPLKGIGVGKLPLTTSGLTIGIMRKVR